MRFAQTALLIGVLACGAITAQASPALSTVNAVVAPNPISAPNDWLPGTSFSVSPFNTSLGHLEQVDVYLGGTLSGSLHVFNTNTPGSPDESFDLLLSTLITAYLPGNTVPLTVSSNTNFAGTLASQASTDSQGLSGSNSAHATITTGLDAYQNGAIAVNVTSVGSGTGSFGSHIQTTPSSSATADLSVVYTYTLPEPATLVLLALGATPLLRRRR